jgi:hypothetical protein
MEFNGSDGKAENFSLGLSSLSEARVKFFLRECSMTRSNHSVPKSNAIYIVYGSSSSSRELVDLKFKMMIDK